MLITVMGGTGECQGGEEEENKEKRGEGEGDWERALRVTHDVLLI